MLFPSRSNTTNTLSTNKQEAANPTSKSAPSRKKSKIMDDLKSKDLKQLKA